METVEVVGASLVEVVVRLELVEDPSAGREVALFEVEGAVARLPAREVVGARPVELLGARVAAGAVQAAVRSATAASAASQRKGSRRRVRTAAADGVGASCPIAGDGGVPQC